MKKFMALGLCVLGLSLMSVSNYTGNGVEEFKKHKLVTHTCPNGYEFEYYEIDGYSDDDYEDMQNAACNDPDNQSIDPA